jgi:molecular chaperone DnaK
MDWLVDEFKKDNGIDLAKDNLALQRIKEVSEKAKIELSSSMETEINLPFITSGADGPKHLLYKLSRAQFENMVGDQIAKSIELVKQTLKEAGLEANQINEVVMVGGQTRMPKIQEEVRKLFNKEPNKEVNPDEVVAIGAAIQGGIMQGNVRDVLLLDVTPLSLGIETMGGVDTVLIPKNTTVPTAKQQTFSTAADNQPSVEIHVLQGERPMAQDNKTLGRFMLDGIPSAPRGTPQIEVSFDIDANGILSVSAKDKTTGKSQSIKIEGSAGLSKEEIEKMKKDAELHAAEDKQKQLLIETRNIADTLVYSAEKTLKDAGDKVSADVKKPAEDKLAALKTAKETDNIEEIKKLTQELSAQMQKVAAELQKAGGQQSGQPNPSENKTEGPNAQEKEPKAEEGEFKEKSE